METIKITNLTFSYPEQEKKAINNVSLTVNNGDFLVICGHSGCGKSTLLRQLKTVLAPHGVKSGEILFNCVKLEEIPEIKQASLIGFVGQSPENQIVTDKVWHELAFGLESLGKDTPIIRQRVAEMASFFGIQNWFYKKTSELSGGQKQLLNLASVMVMNPEVLVLDEPTAQLDPIAASDFLSVLGKINRELGTTIILTEHRLEEALPLANRVAVMQNGELISVDTVYNVGKLLKNTNNSMFLSMPTAMRVWAKIPNDLDCPVTVKEGRIFLGELVKTKEPKALLQKDYKEFSESPILKADEVWFKYEKESSDIVKGLSLQLHKGEFLAILGGNGTGKTTSLKILAGLKKAYRGTVECRGTVAVLPQNPQTLFVKKTVREDLFEIFGGKSLTEQEKHNRIKSVVSICRLEELLDRHPYDLSGGEQQRAALAKVLLLEPEILMLDEPTKGFDAEFKQTFAEIINTLLNRNVAVLMISHDIEFCAVYAHRCALFFDGNIVSEGNPHEFFAHNSFYTTAANRISRGIINGAVTEEDILLAFGMKLHKNPNIEEIDLPKAEPLKHIENKKDKLPIWRRILAFLSGVTSLVVLIKALSVTDLTLFIKEGSLTELGSKNLLYCGIFVVALFIFALSIGKKSKPPINLQTEKEKRKLNKRTIIASILILAFIPLTLFVGLYYFENAKYYFISLLVLLQCMLPFFLVFEGRKPQARELIIIAVLCAIGVAGRAVFFMLPQFKPVMAITIIGGVAFGGETGFLVGAMTMLCSNVLFSQGPLTPWQMFSMGIVGFLAGVLFKKGWIRRNRLSICIFGAISAVVIYGGIMNFASGITMQRIINLPVLLSYYVSGFPFDCVHAVATFIFLWLGAEPMLAKLDRIKIKYGLIE